MAESAVNLLRHGWRALWRAWLLLALGTGATGGLAAKPAVLKRPEDQARIEQLKSLSVEELLQIEITSVSRRPERLAESASAVQVLTAEDIRRSGAATLPQVLRLAPNLHTARVGAASWGITARGFNDPAGTANKLLVMIDGRSVYSPLFSGTFWDVQDVFLPDVERIEVISGPGGATWGANAVNGVINVLTKGAEATQGTLVYAGGGGEERGLAGVRHGGQVGEQTYYRVYAKHHDLDRSRYTSGASAPDRTEISQVGFRVDHQPYSDRALTWQGDYYRGEAEQPGAPPGTMEGFNSLLRYTHLLADGSELRAQVYFDRAERQPSDTFSDVLDTYDLDVQHHLRIGVHHEIVWGGGYRVIHDRIQNLPEVGLLPANSTEQLGNVFVQDSVALFDGDARLTVGAKFEHHTYSGSEGLPSIRLAWRVSPNHTAWAAVSRAVRTPSRLDRDLYAPSTPPHVLVAGGPDFVSERLWATELGLRGSYRETASWGLTVFYHDYNRLRSVEQPLPLQFANGVEGYSYGLEAVVHHDVADWWRWSAGYVFLRQRTEMEAGSRDLNFGQAESANPRHQALVRTAFDLPGEWELDFDLRAVDRLHVVDNGQSVRIPAYAQLSARVGWRPRDNWELSLVGRNLLRDRHLELGGATNRREIERSLYAKAQWTF